MRYLKWRFDGTIKEGLIVQDTTLTLQIFFLSFKSFSKTIYVYHLVKPDINRYLWLCLYYIRKEHLFKIIVHTPSRVILLPNLLFLWARLFLVSESCITITIEMGKQLKTYFKIFISIILYVFFIAACCKDLALTFLHSHIIRMSVLLVSVIILWLYENKSLYPACSDHVERTWVNFFLFWTDFRPAKFVCLHR